MRRSDSLTALRTTLPPASRLPLPASRLNAGWTDRGGVPLLGGWNWLHRIRRRILFVETLELGEEGGVLFL